MSVLQGLYFGACRMRPAVFACVGVFSLGVSNPNCHCSEEFIIAVSVSRSIRGVLQSVRDACCVVNVVPFTE